jgi:putrescine transport system permease protein
MARATAQSRESSSQPDAGSRFLIGLPAIWLGIFFALPFLFILRMSLSDPALAQPPYKPVLDLTQGLAGLWDFLKGLDFEAYQTVLTDPLYLGALGTSLRIAALGTSLTLLVGYPMAYAISRSRRTLRPLLLAAVILPFWTSFLIRVYAWIGILRQDGFLNQLLLWLGMIQSPIEILGTEIAILIGIVYSYLPFMLLPLYAALERQDASLREAAEDLGASAVAIFWKITVPLSASGILGGCLLVFIPVLGEFIIPDLLGGSDTLMIGRLVWTEFFANRDWPVASALSVLLLMLLMLPLMLARSRQDKAGGMA